MIIAADNLHALNPRVAEALRQLDPGPIRELVWRLEGSGAQYLDLNPGRLSKRHRDRMVFLVETVQEVSALPLILDSPDAQVLAAGLRVCREKPILNALTLEEEKLAEILPLAVAHDTDLVLLLLDAKSFPPPSLEEKLSLAMELRERSLTAGVKEERLIYDPLVPPLTWPDATFRLGQVAQTIRLLASGSVFPEPARTMVGLSNLRSGARQLFPWRLEEDCLGMLAGAGLTFALADVLQPEFKEGVHFLRQLGFSPQL